MPYIRNGTQINDDGTYIDPTGQTGYSAALDQTGGNSASHASAAKYGYTSGGLMYLLGNDDSYINAVNQQSLWDREDLRLKAAETREDYSMDKLVAAAKRNGINPIFLLDALSSNPVGNAASYATSAAKANSYDTNAKTDQATSAKLVGALVAAVAMIMVRAIAAA